MKVEDRSFWNMIGVTVIIYIFFVFFLGSPDFLSELFAGILGILIGFSLNRRIDARKDEQDKKDLLRDLRDELEETKRACMQRLKYDLRHALPPHARA